MSSVPIGFRFALLMENVMWFIPHCPAIKTGCCKASGQYKVTDFFHRQIMLHSCSKALVKRTKFVGKKQ